jgi:hypothetical protein
MRWIIWPRQYGKTYRVKKWWLEDPANRAIVTMNEALARVRRSELADELMQAYPGYSLREVDRAVKAGVMSWRSWENRRLSRPPKQVALDDCAKEILRRFVGPVHELVIISDAGRNEEPDPVIQAQVDAFRAKCGYPDDEE